LTGRLLVSLHVPNRTTPDSIHTLAGPTPDLNLTAATTALLVVDMQYFDAHPEWGEGRTAIELGVAHCFDPYYALLDGAIPNIQQLLATFRERNMEVIHLRVAEWTNDSRDVGRHQLVRGLIVPADSREAQPLDELAPAGDELVVSKSAAGAFAVTNLDRLLRNLGITALVVTGTSTGGCVENAVRDAADLGYDVIVAADACADATPADHERALRLMQGGLIRVSSTAAILEQFARLPGGRAGHSGLDRVKQYLPAPPAGPPPPDVNPYALIFPPALPFEVDRANTALVLIDAQRFFCDPEAGLGKLAQEHGQAEGLAGYFDRVQTALAGMQQLLNAARSGSLRVIHVRTAGQLPDGGDLSRNLQAQGIRLWQGSPEAEIVPGLAPLPGEIVLNKPASGIFTGTGLEVLLRNLGLENLILAGTSYGSALETTIRNASDKSFGAIVVPDACASFHAVQHERLWWAESGLIRVRSVARLAEQLKAV
jgi:nicotinamidase-related amidase